MKDDADPKKLEHLPGEAGLPVVGNAFKLLRDPDAFDERMQSEYGTCFRSRMFGRTGESRDWQRLPFPKPTDDLPITLKPL